MKKIHIIAAGGTISSIETDKGLKPALTVENFTYLYPNSK